MDAANARAHVVPIGSATAHALGGLVAVVVAYYALPGRWSLDLGVGGRVVASITLLVVVLVLQARSVLRSSHPNLRAGTALVVVAALATATFAALHHAVSLDDPSAYTESLDRTDALYFSLTTLATVGYGDIAPSSEVARIGAMIHMVVNLAVIGAAARVLGLVAGRRREQIVDSSSTD